MSEVIILIKKTEQIKIAHAFEKSNSKQPGTMKFSSYSLCSISSRVEVRNSTMQGLNFGRSRPGPNQTS